MHKSTPTKARPIHWVMAFAVMGLSVAQAQPAPTLTLEQVLTEARAHRQEIRAAAARADAAAQLPKVVGSLPDPMLMGGLDHLPFSLMGANYSVQLQQDFPLSRVRGHRATSAQAEADARRAQAATASLDVEAAALRSFLMLLEAQRMLTVAAELKKIAGQVHSAVQARISTGQGGLAESVRADVEVARMQGELDALEREAAGAWAMTEAAMGHTTVAVGTTRMQELARYDAVIHLRTPALASGYNHSNPVRTESPDEAAAIDDAVATAWKGHPRVFFVESTADFLNKAQQAIQTLRGELPDCCKRHVVPLVEHGSS